MDWTKRIRQPPARLKHDNPFQLLISTILSAQSTDVRVNMVTPGLFKKYPTPAALAYANPRDIEQEIRSTGFYRNKTKSILGASKKIVEEFGGEVPRTMEQILTLPGVARKTANVVLGTGFGIASGVVVDTHVQTAFAATGFDEERGPEENRDRSDESDSRRSLDSVFPSTDLARKTDLQGAQTAVHRVQSGKDLLFERQDDLTFRRGPKGSKFTRDSIQNSFIYEIPYTAFTAD